MLIKFCGMRRQADLDTAAALGVDYCGFIFHPKSPRYIEPGHAATLASGHMARVGVFTSGDAAFIKRTLADARMDYAQLHGTQTPACCQQVGPERVIYVLWPQRHASLELLQQEAARYAACCSMYLLDAGQQGGGSGQCMDWLALAGISLPHPFFLAGGLDADNALEAATICRPHGLDFNSGIEDAPAQKNAAKMAAVVRKTGKTQQDA